MATGAAQEASLLWSARHAPALQEMASDASVRFEDLLVTSPTPAPQRSPEGEAQARFSVLSAQEAAECVRWWCPPASVMEGLTHPTPQCGLFLPPIPPPLGWVRTACSPLGLYSVGMGTAWVYRRSVCTTGLNKDVGFCDSRVVVRLPFPGAPVSFPLKHLCGVFC